MTPNEKCNRRRFIKTTLIAGATAGIAAPLLPGPEQTSASQITMLTSDGKLVTVNKSVLEQTTGQKKATEREVFEWMNNKHKT
ncbi:twin-arginine translocation signal domain-containing protein [Danxiaibacter flavus]|uniref:Twin-arginine translocation signal domain-containing protein n=1 Tax=Danxiaibacter flavus TaxID=3049108 RepID=A0ABV3ZG33_9BACT|nr:twin-arginine translocation signal domain-containing protein [Chitinophagaceae bacterium DXS]